MSYELCLSPQHERSQSLASTGLWWAGRKGCCICKDREKIIIYVHADLHVLILYMWYCSKKPIMPSPTTLFGIAWPPPIKGLRCGPLQSKPTEKVAKSSHRCAMIATWMLNGSTGHVFQEASGKETNSRQICVVETYRMMGWYLCSNGSLSSVQSRHSYLLQKVSRLWSIACKYALLKCLSRKLQCVQHNYLRQ